MNLWIIVKQRRVVSRINHKKKIMIQILKKNMSITNHNKKKILNLL